MASPRLRAFALPLLAGLLAALALRATLRSLGESLVPLLDPRAAASSLSRLVGLVPALLLFVAARALWQRSARDRRARGLAAAVVAVAALVSYTTSGGVTTRGDFHGLLTPEPNTSSIETSSSRPQIRYAINTHGFRAPDFAIEKAAGTFRVALVGGSFVFGAGVEQDQSLAASLAALARARFPARSIEVLNLGIAGDGLASHLAVAELAERTLSADLVVLCVLLPAELGAIDAQNERRAPLHVDAFSLVSWALGMQAARFFWDEDPRERGFTPARVARLRALLDDYRASRQRPDAGAPPLFVLSYEELPEPARSAFSSLPGATLLPAAPHGAEHKLPGDGHPSALGHRVAAESIAQALAGFPALAR
jgi:lysophospholipase L1-like esterase